MRDKGEKS
jgi:hypothetical protein